MAAALAYLGYLRKSVWPGDLAGISPPRATGAAPPTRSGRRCSLRPAHIGRVKTRWRRQPYLAAGWLWYLIALVPVIGVVQVGAQAMADRYTYLPSVGIFIMLAWGIADLSAGWRHQKIILASGGAAAAAALLLATRTQVGCWHDSVALFHRAVTTTQNNYVMHHSLGWALARQNRLDSGRTLQRALQLRPDPETELDSPMS
jgi:hypothetical protein